MSQKVAAETKTLFYSNSQTATYPKIIRATCRPENCGIFAFKYCTIIAER